MAIAPSSRSGMRRTFSLVRYSVSASRRSEPLNRSVEEAWCEAARGKDQRLARQGAEEGIIKCNSRGLSLRSFDKATPHVSRRPLLAVDFVVTFLNFSQRFESCDRLSQFGLTKL